jgi:alpha-beta hydrolase superfamily lysophospholipase
MVESEVQTRSADGTLLAGTLTRPKGMARSVVLMLHGTGPLDRNENASQTPGQRLDIFNALARDLAAAGHASLRYDKRGCGASGGDYLLHGQTDLIADARAWADDLAAQGIGPLVVLGHSEGTLLAPRVALGRKDVAGIVLICPFLQPVEVLLRQQAAQLAREARDAPGFWAALRRGLLWLTGGYERAQDRLIARLKTTDAPVLRVMGQQLPARSLRDMLGLNPAGIHGANALPTLVLVAGKDLQCPPGDGAAIAAMNPKAELSLVDDLTHILRRDPGHAGFAGYAAQLRHPVDPVVAATINAWLNRLIDRA